MRDSWIAALVLAVLAAARGEAHHSNAIFDLGAVLDLRGTVTRYDWRNPHVYIYVDAASEPGASTEWRIEADPTPIMARSGWAPDTLAIGDAVTLRVHPDATGRASHALLISLAKSDGVFLTMRAGGRDAAEPA